MGTLQPSPSLLDSLTMLPVAVKADLLRHLNAVRGQHEIDLQAGAGWVELPWALARKYPQRRARVALAVGVPGDPHVFRPDHRRTPTSSPSRIRPPACRPDRCPSSGHRQARELPHVSPLLCHPPAGGRPRHPDSPGTPRPPGRQHHHDLNTRPEPGPRRRPRPCRPHFPCMTRSTPGRHAAASNWTGQVRIARAPSARRGNVTWRCSG